MLAHPTHERLIALGLTGMAKAFEDQRRSPDIAALSFEERLGLMVDREAADRDTKRIATRLKFAALRQNAVVEDVDLRTPRGFDRALFQKLAAGDWITRAEGLSDHGTDRSRKELDCLRARPQSLPGRAKRPLSTRSKAIRGVGARARRWALRQAPQEPSDAFNS